MLSRILAVAGFTCLLSTGAQAQSTASFPGCADAAPADATLLSFATRGPRSVYWYSHSAEAYCRNNNRTVIRFTNASATVYECPDSSMTQCQHSGANYRVGPSQGDGVTRGTVIYPSGSTSGWSAYHCRPHEATAGHPC